MSYNITRWKTKELHNLLIPVRTLFMHERGDWYPKAYYSSDGTVGFCVGDTEVCGTVEREILTVSSIKIEGEGSGTAMNWIWEPALKHSTGTLIASCVWEGGESVSRLHVHDGVVKWVEVDI